MLGYWWVGHGFEGSPGVLIFDEKGHAVQFLTTKDRRKGQSIMRLWVRVDDPVTLRFRLSSKGESWTRTIERTESGFTIFAGDIAFPVWRAERTELPGWLEADYQAAIQKMVEQENDA
ncbi:hypothetical protein [Verrucomicrobium spinosum]|uniref:hypothetical protein n=1 Tax=Verrucomicrobium spinosum TaxID=2736 RepID=UPI0012E14EB5|nr:hypothetical protein [Verrucomicrobium spinosum]